MTKFPFFNPHAPVAPEVADEMVSKVNESSFFKLNLTLNLTDRACEVN